MENVAAAQDTAPAERAYRPWQSFQGVKGGARPLGLLDDRRSE
jgi:hypothetical protein